MSQCESQQSHQEKKLGNHCRTLRQIAVWMMETRGYVPMEGALQRGDLSQKFKAAVHDFFAEHYAVETPEMIRKSASAHPEFAAHMLKHMVEYRADLKGGHHVAELADKALRSVCKDHQLTYDVRVPA